MILDFLLTKCTVQIPREMKVMIIRMNLHGVIEKDISMATKQCWSVMDVAIVLLHPNISCGPIQELSLLHL